MTEKRKVFNEAELIDQIHHVNDPILGEVAFGDLTIEESIELQQKTNMPLYELGLEVVFKMRQKANPELTMAVMKKLPLAKGTKLITLLMKESGFLSEEDLKTMTPNLENLSKVGTKQTKNLKRKLKRGLKKTQPRKKSVS